MFAGLYLAFNIGANDVANTVSTSVGSKALSIKKAIILAGIFEFLGAFSLGDHVTQTIKQGFVDPQIFAQDPIGFAYGMTAAILATSFWLQFATIRGLPVSTTHSIVGAVLGFAIVQGGISHIKYKQLFTIFFSWLLSPILGGIISYIVLRFILKFIIDKNNPHIRAKYLLPAIISLAVFILSFSFTPKITKAIFDHEIAYVNLIISLCISFVIWLIFYKLGRKIAKGTDKRRLMLFYVEKFFAKAQGVTVCFLAFAHGSNDVANAIGPASAVLQAATTGSVEVSSSSPTWLMLVGALGIVIGLIVFGRKVIETIGQKITSITPTRGFSAEIGASFTIIFGSLLGLPLSSTHILVGSVIGVGLARGINGIDFFVIKKIARSWIVTMPITAMLSMFFCLLLKLI